MSVKYQTQFEINRGELEVIEKALREQATTLSLKMLDQLEQDEQQDSRIEDELKSRVTAVQSVLGKLHNQKIWFVPEKYVPLG
ncbi:MAG: hypothetical protein V3U65_06110 [Granulosicoccaceae bacterium]